MKKFNETYENILNEAAVSYRPIKSNYIYFLDDQQLYMNEPYYKLLGGPEELAKAQVRGWKKVKVAVGEDIRDIVPGNKVTVDDFAVWFEITGNFPADHLFPALISL